MPVTVLSFMPVDLAGGDAILDVADALAAQRQAGERLVALVTAMAGVSDMLFDSIRQGNYRSVYTKLLAAHTSAARRLARDEAARKVLIQDMTDILDAYNWLGKSLVNRPPTPAEADTITNLGERLSARLLAANLQGRGIQAMTLNLSDLISRHQPAANQHNHVRSKLLPLLDGGYLPIVARPVDLGELDLAALVTAACA